MHKEGEDKVIVSLKRTRKAFLPEYICGVFLLIVLLASYSKSIVLPFRTNYLLMGLAGFAFVSVELSRLLIHYQITPDKLIISQGIIKKHNKNVHFHPLGFVPDINLKQSFIQRLLRYGTVFIHGSGENHLELKDINNPQQILKKLEKLIEENRTPSTKRKDNN